AAMAAMTSVMAVAFAGAAQASDLWLHVNVREADGGRVNVNLPLSVVQAATALIPEDARHSGGHHGKMRIDGRDMSVADLRELWRSVKDAPDANFVTVDEKDGKVKVSKSGRYLLIRADDRHGKHSQVDVRVPVAVVEALLSGSGDEFNVGAAIEALARQGEGELVTVNDE